MPRKGENIYKRKDGRWEARYIHHYEKGKAKYRSVYGKTYTEAKVKREEILSDSKMIHVSVIKQRALLDELCLLWLGNRKPNVKESTYTRYVRIVDKYILIEFRAKRIDQIDAERIQTFQAQLKERLADKTVNDIMCVFKSIWKFGQMQGYPCCEWVQSGIKVKKAKEITIISQDVRDRMAKAFSDYNQFVAMGVCFSLLTGVRIGEICGLRWGDIDLQNGYATIRRTVERISDLSPNAKQKTKVVITEPKTENSERIIPMPKYLVNYIKRYERNSDCYILTGSTKNTEPHTFYTRYKTFLRKNDLGDYTFHQLRHTFATLCVEQNFDLKSLSEILGHADVQTTMNLYVHPTLQMKKRQMDTLRL